MNITFLIGNGFDLNLGLKTRYSDFLKEYKIADDTDSDHIRRFKESILRGEKLWSCAEKAFGEYTSEFAAGSEGVFKYCECHTDFCEKLAKYLEIQQNKIKFESLESRIVSDFSNSIINYYMNFRPQQKGQIVSSTNNASGGTIYNFISFNYTSILDKCVSSIKGKANILGTRQFRGTMYKNQIGTVLHVHGYTNRNMVLGVNDKSQISNLDLFQGQPEEYLNQIIKINTNMMNEEFTDKRVHELLQTSDLIYIYGMSIGETDALWWERICDLMKSKPLLNLIIQKYDAPKEGLIRTLFVSYEKKIRKEFVDFSGSEPEIKKQLEQRIHIDRGNIFEGLKDIVDDKENRSIPEPPKIPA